MCTCFMLLVPFLLLFAKVFTFFIVALVAIRKGFHALHPRLC
jgi:hypothetical protein